MHGGNVYDQFTDSELPQAAQQFSDLYCIRLTPVEPAKAFNTARHLYVDLAELRRMKCEVWFLQNRPTQNLGLARQIALDPENDHTVAGLHDYLLQSGNPNGASRFVARADRIASMLFDADPESTIQFAQGLQFGSIVLQGVDSERLKWEGERPNVVATVRGRFAGTIYSRVFTPPSGNPYVFLGRYRVAVCRGSALEARLIELEHAGMQVRIADLVATLLSDSQGFPSSKLAGLVPDPGN
jgi:hypothetical protein